MESRLVVCRAKPANQRVEAHAIPSEQIHRLTSRSEVHARINAHTSAQRAGQPADGPAPPRFSVFSWQAVFAPAGVAKPVLDGSLPSSAG